MKKEDYKNLYLRALKNQNNAYAPYSKYKVGAALLTTSGEVFDGVNVENSSYGATICAERAAISAAICSGKRNIEAIAVVGNNKKAWPCGICRQVLFEFGDEIKIVTGDSIDNLEIEILSDLLPKGFKL